MIINPYRFASAGGNAASYIAEQDVDSPLSRWLTPASGTAWDDDIVATGNDATSVNTPTLGSADPWAGTDGVFLERDNAEYITAPDSTSLDITADLTLECWVRVSSYPASSLAGVISKYVGGGNNRSYVCSISSDGFVNFSLSTSGGFQSANSVNGTDNLSTNWHHIVCTFEPSVRQAIYVDGVLDAEKTSSVASSIYNSNAVFNIGLQYYETGAQSTSNNGGRELFDGELFAPTIYNTALSSTRVAAHYDAAGI